MFCPHSVFMCFVWIWEQTAIISLYSINWLVFITETESVYCAVRTGFRHMKHVILPLKADLPTSNCGGSGLIPGNSVWVLWWTLKHCDSLLSGYFGFPCQCLSPVTCSYQNTNDRSLGTFQKAVLFRKSWSGGYKNISPWVCEEFSGTVCGWQLTLWRVTTLIGVVPHR